MACVLPLIRSGASVDIGPGSPDGNSFRLRGGSSRRKYREPLFHRPIGANENLQTRSPLTGRRWRRKPRTIRDIRPLRGAIADQPTWSTIRHDVLRIRGRETQKWSCNRIRYKSPDCSMEESDESNDGGRVRLPKASHRCCRIAGASRGARSLHRR